MHLSGEDFEYGSWKPDGHDLHIEYSKTVIESIGDSVMPVFESGAGGRGAETGGVLFGKHDRDLVQVLAWRPLAREDGQPERLSLTENDEASLERLLHSNETDPKLEGLSPVGWMQSTLRRKLSLSGEPLDIYRKHFPEPWQIVLLIRPSFQRPTVAGFFFREENGELRCDASYREFQPFDTVAGAGGSEARAEPPAAPPMFQSAEPPAAPPMFQSVEPRRGPSRWVTWLVGTLVIGAALALAAVAYLRVPAQTDSRPGLKVVEIQDQLRIEWAPAAEADSAVLEIDDSGAKTEKRLDRTDIAGGSFTYQRSGTDVRIRISFSFAGKPAVMESTLFAGPLVGPVKEAAEAKRRITELEVSLEKAEAALRRERARAAAAETK